MAFSVSPSVNIKEFDAGAIIPAVSSTEAGMAGHFKWGPVGVRMSITDEEALVDQVNKPNSNNYVDFFSAANVLSYTNALILARVVATGNSTSTGSARNSIANSANSKNTVIKNPEDYDVNYSSGISGVGDWVAKFPGDLGNSLKVSVCPSVNAWSRVLTGNVSISSNSSTLAGKGTSFTTQVTVGDFLILGPDRAPVQVLTINSANNITLASRYSGNSVPMNSVSTRSNNCERRWEYFNYFDNVPGTSAYTSRVGGSTDEMHVAVIDEDGLWTGVPGQILERYTKVSMASDAKTEQGDTNYYKNVVNQQSRYIWWAAHNSNNTNAGSKAAGKTFTGHFRPQSVSMVLGRDGDTPSNADYINGYRLFNSPEDVDISFMVGAGANLTRALDLINNVAEVRKDMLVCLSPLYQNVVNNNSYLGKQAADTVTFKGLLPSSSYYVFDNNWKWQYDKYNDVNRWVPLNADIAGLMARTDLVRDPWWSPAGFNRGQIKNVIKLAYNPSKTDRDLLYKNNINSVVQFQGQGTVLFGDKTGLSTPSPFDRINVRRLFIVIEKAIATASKFLLFEFNDEFTRTMFKNMVEPYLRDIQGRRGITGFAVVVDETVNTPQVVDANEFAGNIFISANRSINNINLNFVATRTGVDFTEIVQQFNNQ